MSIQTQIERISGEVNEQKNLISQIRTALQGKAAGGGTATPTQEKNVEITKNGTVEVLPDDGYALHRVGVSVNVPVPDGYIQPSGTLAITQNGEHNAREYEKVSVDVPIPDGYIQPGGELEITENGTHDVTQYASVNVNVDGASAPDPRDQYQRVEYIESAVEGTYPYIVTDFCADNDSGVEVVASFPTMADRIPMGSRLDSDATRFYCCYPLSRTSSYYGFNTGSTLSGSFSVDTIYRCQTNFLCSRMAGIFATNGDKKSAALISSTLSTQTGPVSIFGFRYCSTGNVTSKREYKFYGARLSQLFEVVREYIPCYRKSDGVVGLYEVFTGEFLTNADADGDGSGFAAGPEIDW